MNNSRVLSEKFQLNDRVIDRSEELRAKEAELVKIIEAVGGVAETKEWSSLKNQVFDGVVSNLERDLLIEAKKDSPDNLKMARINGQLVWAKKYADLDTLANIFRNELLLVRKTLYGKAQEPGNEFAGESFTGI